MKEKREKISFKEAIPISKFRFWGGFIVSILLSFSLYQFFILGRDIFRSYTFTPNFNYLEFTEKELFFYNLFYAFLALIIAQTFFLKIIFDTNKKLGEKRIQFSRKKIVHNQNIWIWFFLFCFIKLAVFYGIMNMSTLFWYRSNFSIFEHLNFSEEYPYLFVLFILVLFLQSWQSLGIINRYYFKYMILSFSIICIIAIVFSQINFVDIETYFKKQHTKNLYIKENIELPNITSTETLHSRNKKIELYVSKNGELYFYGKKRNFSQLKEILVALNNEGFHFENLNYFVQLNIDKNTSLKQLYRLQKVITTYSDFKIAYNAYPENPKFPKRYYQDKPEGVFEGRKVTLLENEIMVQFTKENEILINNSPNNCNEITKNIALHILKDKHYTLVVKLKEDAVFSDYISVLSYTRAGYLEACKIVAREKNVDDYTLYNNPESILPFNIIYNYAFETDNLLKLPPKRPEDD